MISSAQLTSFFQRYVTAFTKQDIESLPSLYCFPTTLNSPDSLVLIENKDQLKETFIDIFQQLNQANLSGAKLINPSFDYVNPSICFVNLGWQLFDDNNAVITEFCAIYYLAVINDELKIISVVTQTLADMLTLPNKLVIEL